MQRVRELAEKVATGKKIMQMFCSDPGLGKTETVLDVLARNNQDAHYCSPDTVQGLCQDLWMHRDTTYFIDDCKKLAKNEALANIGKMAWGPQRLVIVPYNLRISLNEKRRLAGDPRYDPNTPPPEFRLGQYHGLLWNDNDNYADPAVRKHLANGFAALVSRDLDPLWVPSEQQDLLNYTIWMIVNGMLRRHRQMARPGEGGFSLAHQQDVLEYICTHGRRLKELTPRMAWLLAYDRRHDPNYEKAWADRLSPDVRWPGLILPDETPQLMSPSTRKAALNQPGASDEPTTGHEDASPVSAVDVPPPAEPSPAPATEMHSATVPQEPRLSPKQYAAANDKLQADVTPLSRDAITQGIARMLHGRLHLARISGTVAGITVDAYNDERDFLCHSELALHLGGADQFVIEVLGKHKDHYFVKKLPAASRDSITPKIIDWDGVFGPDAKSDLVAACRIAKASKQEAVSVDVIDGKLSFAPGEFGFMRRDLEWVLRKSVTAIKFSKRGVIAVTVPGIGGNYEFFLVQSRM